MRYAIMGAYRGEREEIDSADTIESARYLLGEYRMAYGADWRLWIRRERDA